MSPVNSNLCQNEATLARQPFSPVEIRKKNRSAAWIEIIISLKSTDFIDYSVLKNPLMVVFLSMSAQDGATNI